MRLFLDAKAWQLFVVILGGLYLPSFLGGVLRIHVPPAMGIFTTIIYIGCLAGWLWTLGTELNKRVPAEIRMDPRYLRPGLIYAFGIFTLSSTIRGLFGFEVWKTVSPLFTLLQIFAVVCILYAMYFVAKNLAMVEKQEEVKLYDYAGLMLLLYLFPIGVWIIQPRINEMFKNEDKVYA